MADPLSIATSVYTALKELNDTIEQLRENQKSVYKLVRDLINGTLEFINIRKSCPGDYSEIDFVLGKLTKEFGTVRVECEGLLINPGERRLKRSFEWCKSLYNAGAIKKKIQELRERVRDAQQDFWVRNGLALALNAEDLKGTTSEIQGTVSKMQGVVSELQVNIHFLVQEADGKPKEANKIFGVDRMTREERKAALRKTTLDLSVTTKDENLVLLRLKIRTLQKALETGTPTLYQDSGLQTKQGYNPEPDDPFYDVYKKPLGSWRRQDALLETISLLSILQNPRSMAATPTIVLFIRADSLSLSLRSLGLRKEALQLCTITHDVIRKISRCDPDGTYLSYLAQSLCTLAVCHGDMGDLKEALAAGEDALNIYRALSEATPGAFTSQLARSLIILSLCLIGAGKRAEALSPIKEAVEIQRALAKADPKALNPDLVLALNKLFVTFSIVGRRDEPLAPIQEAVEIRRAISKDNPKTLNDGLAMSLTNLSLCLRDAGNLVEALFAIQEAESLFRALADDNSEAFASDLALCLNNEAIILREAGKMEDALSTILEVEKIYRTLVEDNLRHSIRILQGL